jgi:hypothetical protein
MLLVTGAIVLARGLLGGSESWLPQEGLALIAASIGLRLSLAGYL